jgi:hypothetical protein
MIKFVALIIYFLSGELKIEQKQYNSRVECIAQAGKRVDVLEDRDEVEMLLGACVESKIVQA